MHIHKAHNSTRFNNWFELNWIELTPDFCTNNEKFNEKMNKIELVVEKLVHERGANMA